MCVKNLLENVEFCLFKGLGRKYGQQASGNVQHTRLFTLKTLLTLRERLNFRQIRVQLERR